MRFLVVGAVLGVLGCGDNARVIDDASTMIDATDASVDPDGAGGEAGTATLVATTDTGAPLATLDFASTVMGQQTVLTLKLRNDGAIASGPIALSFTGPSATDYVIDQPLTTCAGAALAAGASCTIGVVFRPLSAGTLTAALAFNASPGGSGQVALSGLAVIAGVHFVPPSLALGALETGTSATVTIQLRNDGATTAPIDSIAISGVVIARPSTTCAATLAPSTGCDITVQAAAPTLGALDGNLSVTSSGSIYSAPTIGFGVHRVTVIKGGNYAGTGDGTITSSPAGIDCGATCTDVFTAGVVLTVAPDAGSVFTGWSIPGCGTNLTCTVPANIPHEYVMAGFAAKGGTNLLSIVLAPEAGAVRVHRAPSVVSPGDRLATCYASCTIAVQPGDVIELGAYALAAGHAYSANCTTNSDPAYRGTCQVTAAAGTTTVTVTFTPDMGLAWARAFPTLLDRSAIDGSGNLIASMGPNLMKLSAATGDGVWMWPYSIRDLATGPGDTVYVITTTGELLKLDPDGQVLWARTIPMAIGGGGGGGGSSDLTTNIDVDTSGAVAVHGGGLAVWDAAGTLTWSRAETFWQVPGIAFEPGGNILIGRYDSGLAAVYGYRYAAADGSRLADVPGGIGQEGFGGGGLGVDANGQISTMYSGHNRIVQQTGSVVTSSGLGPGAQYLENGLRVAPSGDIATATIEANGITGSATRSNSMNVMLTNVLALRTLRPFASFGASMRGFALGDAGHLAAIGLYNPICPNSDTTCKQLGWAKAIAP